MLVCFLYDMFIVSLVDIGATPHVDEQVETTCPQMHGFGAQGKIVLDLGVEEVVVDEELALLVVAVAGGDGSGMHDVAVASVARIVYAMALTHYGWHHGSVLIVGTDGEAHVLPQGGTVYLVPGVAVEVSLATYPVGKDVGMLRFVGKAQVIGLGTIGMYMDGVFEHIHLWVAEHMLEIML